MAGGSDPTDLPPTTTTTRSSPDSSDRDQRRLFETNKRGLKRLLKKAIRAGTGVPHRLLTTEEERDWGLYLADDSDEEDVADPLAGLMARRGILPGTSDFADILELAIAVLAYFTRQLQLRAQIRRAAGTAQPGEEEQAA